MAIVNITDNSFYAGSRTSTQRAIARRVQQLVEEGADIEQNVAYVMMHMQGTPAVMQQNPTYDDVVGDILRYFTQKVRTLREMGVTDLIIDPGFGFGNTLEHNYALLRNLPVFQVLDLPILVGVSRKSMLTKPLGIDATQALAATQAVDTIALLNGASILRVHDVRPAVEAVKLCALYQVQPAW